MVTTTPNAARIEAFLALAASTNPGSANDIFDDIDQWTLTKEERHEWHSSIMSFCDKRPDRTMPSEITIGLLELVGVKTLEIGEVGCLESNSELKLVEATLRFIEAVDIEGLMSLSRHPLTEADKNSTWDIDCEMPDVLFVDKEAELACVSDTFLDWLPGVTQFDPETSMLRGFQIVIAPYGTDSTIRVVATAVDAHVSDGKLMDIQVHELME